MDNKDYIMSAYVKELVNKAILGEISKERFMQTLALQLEDKRANVFRARTLCFCYAKSQTLANRISEIAKIVGAFEFYYGFETGKELTYEETC